MSLHLKKIRKGEAPIALIVLALGAILLVAFFIYSRGLTGETYESMNSATAGLDAMINLL